MKVMFELLKNSMRATLETHGDDAPLVHSAPALMVPLSLPCLS